MSNNVFSKTIKDLLPEIATAIYDEIKVPRVGSQRIRVSGFTRDVLEGIYQHLDKMLTGKNREAYKICFIAERAGKTVPITPVERVMEYRTTPSIKALVVFDPWKIEEYGRHMFLHYSFREFPLQKFLEDYAVDRINKAPAKIRNLFFEAREMFAGNFPHREKELREAMFAKKLAADKYTYASFGAGLVYFNAFPDFGINDKNAMPRIAANARISRLFIHSRLPMNERVLLLCPKDKENATKLLEFFIAKDGVLPEFWLLEIVEEKQELGFDRWSSPIAAHTKRPFVASFDGIGRDRRAEREIVISWDMPYGTVPFGSIAFRVWNENVIVTERIMRGGGSRFVLDLEGVEPGVYQIQAVAFGADSTQIGSSWSAPFWWPGLILTGEEMKKKDSNRITWLHGPTVNDPSSALYDNMRHEPAQKRKKPELLENSPKVNPVPFPSGDGVQEIVLPDHSRYFIRVPEVFRTLEKVSLEEVKGLNKFKMDMSQAKPSVESEDLEHDAAYEEFIKVRKLLVMQLRRMGGSPSTVNLLSAANLCVSYLNSYLDLLDKMLKSRAKVIRDDILFIETIRLTVGDKLIGILTLPTHPIEIAFKMGYQQLISNAWQNIFKSKSNDLSPFPPTESNVRSEFIKVLSTAENRHFVLVDVPYSGFGLYLADGVPQSELMNLWHRYISSDKTSLMLSTRSNLKESLARVVSGRSVSIAAVGFTTTEGVMRFCRTLSESVDDPELHFDIRFYGTPAGVLDRTYREIESLKREFCLYDLSSDPDEWNQRFPYDRFSLHAASTDDVHSHHLAYIMPDFTASVSSFESRGSCCLSLLEGLFPINISTLAKHGEVQWSGAGPRKETSASEKTFEVLESIHDSFSAASSKVALQKTSAFSHLSVNCTVAQSTSEFLSKIVSNSVITMLVSYVGAIEILSTVSPATHAVGSPSLNLAIALETARTPAGRALSHHCASKSINSSEYMERLCNISPCPTRLYQSSDGASLLENLLVRKTLAMLSQTRDGILLDPQHHPDLFTGTPWPSLILFKFGADGLIPLIVQPFNIPRIEKPEDVTLPPEFLEKLTACGNHLHKIFAEITTQPDGLFSWARFGEILAIELQSQLRRGEMADKDAVVLAERINATISGKIAPSRETIREFPLILLPDAKGQLAGRAFSKVHPLCRMMSGEEIAQWLKK